MYVHFTLGTLFGYYLPTRTPPQQRCKAAAQHLLPRLSHSDASARAEHTIRKAETTASS